MTTESRPPRCPVTAPEPIDWEWVECNRCMGSGRDEYGTDPLGQCERCFGKGGRDEPIYADEDEEDDDAR